MRLQHARREACCKQVPQADEADLEVATDAQLLEARSGPCEQAETGQRRLRLHVARWKSKLLRRDWTRQETQIPLHSG